MKNIILKQDIAIPQILIKLQLVILNNVKIVNKKHALLLLFQIVINAVMKDQFAHYVLKENFLIIQKLFVRILANIVFYLFLIIYQNR